MKLCNCLMTAASILLILAIGACANVPEPGIKGTTVVYWPDWWQYQSPQEDYIYSYGQGLSNTVEKSLEAATNNAQDEASQYVEAQLNKLVQTFASEAGVVDPKALSITGKLVHAISGARYSKSVQGKSETREISDRRKSRYRSWVQLVIPKADLNANLINNLSNDEALSALFRNSPSFRSMEQSLEQRY